MHHLEYLAFIKVSLCTFLCDYLTSRQKHKLEEFCTNTPLRLPIPEGI